MNFVSSYGKVHMDVININHVITHYERVASLCKRYSLEKETFATW